MILMVISAVLLYLERQKYLQVLYIYT